MNITINNYEEYFLLYADGELNAAGKLAVERFVENNPDLAEELTMLMETVLACAPVTMPGKDLLLKPEAWTGETLTPHQQNMLLLLDEALPAEAAAELQRIIKKDPGLQKDWTALQQTKLEATAVEMPGKERLYRHEKNRKPIPIAWVKWMAAAAVLAGLGWYTIGYFKQPAVSTSSDVVAVIPPAVVKPEPVKNDAAPAVSPLVTDATLSPEQQSATVAVKRKQATANNNEPADVTENIVKNKQNSPIPTEERAPVQTNNQPVYEVAQNYPVTGIVKEDAPAVASASGNLVSNNSKNIPAVSQEPAQPALTQQAVYKEDAFDEPEYVTIAGAHIKKQKLRGIFRNVSRSVGRTFDKSNVAQVETASLNK